MAGASAALVLAVLVAYAPLAGADFVHFDDDKYVLDHPTVRQGLTLEGARWAFTRVYDANWIPLVWLSLMLDHELHGAEAPGYLATNVGLHALSAVLLLLALRRLTGRLVPSLFAAGVFALHPLHVESVAWVAERKDTLSGAFWMAALLAWARYVERPSVVRYLAVAAALALGLLAKATLVTLPFVLLLLDAWPTARLRPGEPGAARRLGRLVAEKLPLLALSLAGSLVTLLAQSAGHALVGERLSVGVRVANAALAYVAYLGKALWPDGLIFFYPHPGDEVSRTAAAASLLLLLLATVATLAVAWRRPRLGALPVGWLWYLGTLVPMIGLVQVGSQAMADRYTYIPLVGLGIAVGFGLAETCRQRPRRARALALGGGLLLALWTAASFAQARHWTSAEALYAHALQVQPDNPVAHYQLARLRIGQARFVEAETHLRRALVASPDASDVHANLGVALLGQGRADEAVGSLEHALATGPPRPEARLQLARALIVLGRHAEADRELERVVAGEPELGRAWLARGAAAEALGQRRRAASHYARAAQHGATPAEGDEAARHLVELVDGWPEAPPAALRRAATLARRLVEREPGPYDDPLRRLEARLRALPAEPSARRAE